MDLAGSATLLRKIRISQLEPGLRDEVLEFAGEMGYEGTLNASSRLHILLEIYNAEKAKEKKSKRMLRKAENLIMKLAGLHYATTVMEGRRPEARKKERPFGKVPEAMELFISTRMRALFGSIGISDERVMAQALGLLGEKKIEERATLILASNIGQELSKKLFSMRPVMLLEPDDGKFLGTLADLETKKDIVDTWARTREISMPYGNSPQILLMDYPQLTQALGLLGGRKEEVSGPPIGKKEELKYRPVPMKFRDMLKVLEEYGFHVKSLKNEAVLVHESGRILTVSNPHAGEYTPATVRAIIHDLGVTPNGFETVRVGVL
jgi:predicted RNA binding protein YcfA (HicA-like mRNA interferase family)